MLGLTRLTGYVYTVAGCAYRTVNWTNMTHHAQTAPHGRVRPGWAPTTLQSYAPGRHARYWVVADGPAEGEGEGEGKGEGETTDGSGDGWEPMLAAYGTQRAAEDEAQRQVAEGPAGLDGDSIWVREMGWAQHL